MTSLITYIVSGAILTAGLGSLAYQIFHKEKKPKTYKNLDHVKVPLEWKQLKYNAWVRASTVLKMNGLVAETRCEKITPEAGIKVNPKTGQWGRPTQLNGKEYWYAGLSSSTEIKIVGTPEKQPYNRSEAILTHEVAETILNQNPQWSGKTIDERNKFLWSMGL